MQTFRFTDEAKTAKKGKNATSSLIDHMSARSLSPQVTRLQWCETFRFNIYLAKIKVATYNCTHCVVKLEKSKPFKWWKRSGFIGGGAMANHLKLYSQFNFDLLLCKIIFAIRIDCKHKISIQQKYESIHKMRHVYTVYKILEYFQLIRMYAIRNHISLMLMLDRGC